MDRIINSSQNELKSLFGWTARLLLVRQEPRRREEPGTQKSPRKDRLPREEKKPPAPPAQPFRAIGGKNLEALKALGEKLSDKGKKES